MCGIAGLFDIAGARRDRNPAATALRMVNALPHRGPDGRNAWGDAQAGIGLGHGRLAIIDLTPTGEQPMVSADGRYVITYNGEVYNFPQLRADLQARGHGFRGTSDTEVMLAAFVEWGIEAAVRRFVGMFAFAVFDTIERSLHLVRDRLGVKPLYWTIADGLLLFGSELRALAAHPNFHPDVDRAAIDAVIRLSYVPTPRTAFQNVWKLPPATILTIRTGGAPAMTRYWCIEDVVSRTPRGISAEAAIDQIDALLREAVRARLVADVPLGAFLSGGTDSSAVVAVMQAVSERPVRTYTIGFRQAAYDESEFARNVARHLGTDHTEVMLEPRDALDLVGSVADWFDEPFADSSQLPTYLVSRTTRRHVTVALSGDGGDELFGGYPKYQWMQRLWQRLGHWPRPLRAAIGELPVAFPESWLRRGAAELLDSGRGERIGEKARRLRAALSAQDADEATIALAMTGLAEDGIVNGVSKPIALAPVPERKGEPSDLMLRMQAHDLATYLPDDILTKVDRCSMAVSLEAREPLLDHRIVEFVWSLPAGIRRGDGRPKALLHKILERYFPPAFFDRPKRGFSVPLDDWLGGPLREWAEDLLSPASLASDDLLNVERVRRVWQRHLSGDARNATGLWNILMVRAWSKRWLSPKPAAKPAREIPVHA
jgi:asparagine synthase (glutamine-hydrolysing)